MTMRRLLLVAAELLALCACSPKAPLVGISTQEAEGRYDYLTNTYACAITAAGGIPVLIPTIETPEQAKKVLSRIDGIVFSGGEDVSPEWYGEVPVNETVVVNSIRDRSDSLLARAALQSGKPVLAVCRGSQLMNVILGGSLYQDIPSQLPQAVPHSGARHMIGLEKDGFLAKIYGADSLEVNSSHHQCVKDPASGIKIIARGPDGIVEAWETTQITAVQFHPEYMLAHGDSTWLPFFTYWIDKL